MKAARGRSRLTSSVFVEGLDKPEQITAPGMGLSVGAPRGAGDRLESSALTGRGRAPGGLAPHPCTFAGSMA